MLCCLLFDKDLLQAARLQRQRALEERYKVAEEAKALQQRNLEEAQRAAKVPP